MITKTEIWNGYPIRFVEKELGEWWAVAMDVASALAYTHTPHMIRRLEADDRDAVRLTDSAGRSNRLAVISEFGVYNAIYGSERTEAKAFKRWVNSVLKELRRASGLEGFQVFRMLDKEHQKETMRKLRDGLIHPVRVDFIKANIIANKAVSSNHGYPLMIKKDQMTPDMLLERQPILTDTVRLMEANDSFGLGLSVCDAVYKKYCH